MNKSQSKNSKINVIIFAVLALSLPLLISGLLHYSISLVVFTVSGVLIARQINPNADCLEQLTVGLLCGLASVTLLIYILNMVFLVRVSALTVLLSIVIVAFVGLLPKWRGHIIGKRIS
jgi:hypothetical protein